MDSEAINGSVHHILAYHILAYHILASKRLAKCPYCQSFMGHLIPAGTGAAWSKLNHAPLEMEGRPHLRFRLIRDRLV